MLKLAAVSAIALGVVSADGPGNGVSKSTYAATDPITAKDWLLTYFPVTTADDECTNDLCTCSDDDETWEIQQGRVSLDLSTSDLGVSPGFGMHLVNLTHRQTTGGNTVGEIEEVFATKFGDMSTYDAFMDYNIGLYTSDLDSYIAAFDADSVNYLSTEWVSDTETWNSVIVLVPGTHMVLELFTDSTSKLLANRAGKHYEQRLGARAAARIKRAVNTTSSSGILTAARVSRAASDLDAIDSFYTDAMGATLDVDYTADGIERHCFLYSSSYDVDVCFTSRNASATSRDFTVKMMEDQMNAVHSNLLSNPKCGVDKWLDNHHAYDTQTSGVGSTIVSYIEKNAPYYYCEPSSGPTSSSGYDLHYIIDPTGWGIQLDMQFSSSPSGCSSNLLRAGTYNPACDLGECD